MTSITSRAITIAAGEGAALAGVAVGVVNSGLEPFLQALVIALVSSIIGAIGLVVAARVAGRQANQQTQKLLDGQDTITEHIQDVKDTLANGQG